MIDVQFDNVQITIRAESATEAYTKLSNMLASTEMFVSDTFCTWDVDDATVREWSEDRDTCELWPDVEESILKKEDNAHEQH